MAQDFVSELKSGRDVITGWCAIPNGLVVEALLDSGYDTVTLDMQHGFHDVSSVVTCIASAKMMKQRLIVRIPVGEWGTASRALDMGAAAVIAPMVNNVEDARAFADAMKFPPTGARSWGPGRAMLVTDQPDPAAYLSSANDETLAIAMIETREALDNLDAILAVPGIDGIFVGPSDLSLTFSEGEELKQFGERTIKVIEDIATRTIGAGKIPCIFAILPEQLKLARSLGYRLFALSTDTGAIARGAAQLLSEATDGHA
jgi:4-hydroxy-2-oxoheptanedioate aldolase